MDSTKPETRDALHKELEDFVSELSDPDLTPAGRVAAAMRQVMSQETNAAHREIVLSHVRAFRLTALELLRNCDYQGVAAELKKFLAAISRRSVENGPREQERTQFEIWQIPAQNAGWPDKDYNWLITALRADENITAITGEHALTSSGRQLTRRELRLAHKPPGIPEFEWMHRENA